MVARYGRARGCDRCRRPDASGGSHGEECRKIRSACSERDAATDVPWAVHNVEADKKRLQMVEQCVAMYRREHEERSGAASASASSGFARHSSGEPLLPPPVQPRREDSDMLVPQGVPQSYEPPHLDVPTRRNSSKRTASEPLPTEGERIMLPVEQRRGEKRRADGHPEEPCSKKSST